MQLDDPWAAADAASAGGAQSVHKFMRVSMQDGVHRQPLPPSIRGAKFDAREQEQRRRSAERLRDDREAEAAAGPFIPDVLMPDVFSEFDDADEWLQRSDGVSSLYISDENGALVDWPWETKPGELHWGQALASPARRRHP